MDRRRYTFSDVSNAQYYQLPKFLFSSEFCSLTSDTKILYALLRDRHDLSLKNNWINDNNEVYLIFTRDELCSLMRCTQPTLRKALKQLKDFRLIDEERQGLNRPNLIYLYYVDNDTHEPLSARSERNFQSGVKETFTPDRKNLSVKTENNLHSRPKDIYIQECNNFSPNDTDIKDTNQSQSQTSDQDTDIYISQIKENIRYEKFLDGYFGDDKLELVNELIECMKDIISTDSNYVKIGKKDKIRESVIETYLNLDHDDILEIISRFKSVKNRVVHIDTYLKTMLSNIKQERHFMIQNMITSSLYSDNIDV